jgi:TRAP transporter TAXI family solute receptor
MKEFKKLISAVFTTSVLIFVGFSTLPAQAANSYISIGTGGPTGVYFVVGNSICRMIHKEEREGRKKGRKNNIRCAAPSTGGSNYNIGQIGAGELDFGIAQSDWQYHAFNGSGKNWKKNKQRNLRAVFSVHPEPFHIIVGKNSGINSWTDLIGKKVNIGNPGSGQRGTMEALMDAHGTSVKDFKIATELTSSEQSSALCDGKIDAYVYTVGVPNAGVSISTDGCDARIINLNGPVESKLVQDNPYYAFSTIPAGTYKTSMSDITTFGVKATLVSSVETSPDLVYEVVKAVFENLQDFRMLHPAFANLKEKNMINDGISAPLHKGALRYYREKGWM